MSYRLSPLRPYIQISIYLFMSTLANESIFETLFEETMEELEAKNFQLLFSQSDIEQVAGEIAMDKFLSNNP